MTWWSRFILLGRAYGYTPEEVKRLTIRQASEYLSGIAVEKGDPAIQYEPIDYQSPDEIKFRERLKEARAKLKAKPKKRKR